MTKPGGNDAELDEWVRRCAALESLVRKLSYEVEYEASERVWKGRNYRQDATVRGFDGHHSTTLSPVEEKVFRQVQAMSPLRGLYEVEI